MEAATKLKFRTLKAYFPKHILHITVPSFTLQTIKKLIIFFYTAIDRNIHPIDKKNLSLLTHSVSRYKSRIHYSFSLKENKF